MDAASNKDVVRRIYEDLVNGQRLDLLEGYFSPEYVNHKMPGGREATKQLFVALFDAFPDAQVSIDSVCEAGDRVWVRITMRGTHLGAFIGMPVPVRPLRLEPLTSCGWRTARSSRSGE